MLKPLRNFNANDGQAVLIPRRLLEVGALVGRPKASFSRRKRPGWSCFGVVLRFPKK